jgi:hypothetical protein
MAIESSKLEHPKISPEFGARLARLQPQQKVRAIVLLCTDDIRAPVAKRESRIDRKATIERIRQSAETALPVIDQILDRFGGRRLTHQVNALGSIPVETTSAGISALVASEHVKAILEDQPLSVPEERKQAF